MSARSGLRRATLADVEAVTAHQRAAFERNREIMGVEPMPRTADYQDVLSRLEAWIDEDAGEVRGLLVLDPRPDDLYIWNVSVAPSAQGQGVGNMLLDLAHERAVALQRDTLRLRTAQKMERNVSWYQRRGFQIESIEQLPDRVTVHMVKRL